MERAYWATTNIGPYVEHQVVVFDDGREPDAGWVRTGWFREILPVPVPLDEVTVARPATTRRTRRR